MNVLILGAGGREHTLAWKIAQSPLLDNLFIAPGNAGTAKTGTNLAIPVNDFPNIGKACLDYQIGMVVVGPEEPLVKGIRDYFLADPLLKAIPVIGPDKSAAQLEGSKDFAKAFLSRHGIPTASYQTFTRDTLNEGIEYLSTLNPPYVLKADGLAAGKGVIISHSREQAERDLKALFTDPRFGDAAGKVVIEQFLSGIELSVFILTDGVDYLLLPEAKDYKKIGEGDSGENTGGMGSVSPVPFAQGSFMNRVEETIIRPVLAGLRSEGITYTGFLFIGLMNVNDQPYVIEFNCRLGDPETEVIIPRLRNDLLTLFEALDNKDIKNIRIETDHRTAASIMLVSGGYPGHYEKGKVISGLELVHNSLVFHAGTEEKEGRILTNGGRVLAITSFGDNLEEALSQSYNQAGKIHFDGFYYRNDIGFDLKAGNTQEPKS